ncbi:hypothetical protein AHAS_Ahas10G0072100 [Arachis hypogaea]
MDDMEGTTEERCELCRQVYLRVVADQMSHRHESSCGFGDLHDPHKHPMMKRIGHSCDKGHMPRVTERYTCVQMVMFVVHPLWLPR